ncbi:fatty acid desaturase [Aquiflexum sp.]|uniref:fatty acid desaturase family protein n=1 Tax=Aquiflexum sp. TaxID=1872584 RepID=UPI0035943346
MSISLIQQKPAKVKPIFKKTDVDRFSKTLALKVESYFKETGKSKKGGKVVTIKTIFLLSLFCISYGLLLSNWFNPWGTFFIGLLFGLTHALIVFNIAHDASHNALFKNHRLNRILSYTFNLVGSNSYLWNLSHNKTHHSFPNIADFDPDIHQQAPLIRMSPSEPYRWYNRYQHWYATLLYLIFSIFLVFVKGLKEFFPSLKSKRWLGIDRPPFREYVILFFTKLIYFTYSLLIPLMVLDVTWQQFILGYLGIHFFLSLFLISVLIPVHLVDESEFGTVDQNGHLPDTWTVHIFKNTIDFSRKSKLANFLFGGLNTHIVHHIFPNICHVHYIALSEIIKTTAEEFQIDYHEESMWGAIVSHYKLLKKMGSNKMSDHILNPKMN